MWTLFVAWTLIVPAGPVGLKNYYKNVSENKDISKLVMVLSSASQTLRQEVNGVLREFSSYHCLWEKEQTAVIRVCLVLMSVEF